MGPTTFSDLLSRFFIFSPSLSLPLTRSPSLSVSGGSVCEACTQKPKSKTTSRRTASPWPGSKQYCTLRGRTVCIVRAHRDEQFLPIGGGCLPQRMPREWRKPESALGGEELGYSQQMLQSRLPMVAPQRESSSNHWQKSSACGS